MIERVDGPFDEVMLTIKSCSGAGLSMRFLLRELSIELRAIAEEGRCTLLVISHEGDDFNHALGSSAWYCHAGAAQEVRPALLMDVLLRLESFPAPVILCVEGGCFGIALLMASSCDMVLAERDSLFSLSGIDQLPWARQITGYMQSVIAAGVRSQDLFGAVRARRIGLATQVFQDEGKLTALMRCKASLLAGLYP
ncbi:hypothetical protein EDC56_3659 [Sinobacterium caligoides]|uniref:Enoyl-CoA hydratase/carnithine racemase n=1 Tax=Sinobacterium caligoides TaxID=933926 RepID=A0A3N2DDW9_9GAMM|nr:hypothetical protein [Sinobacterium caligoides]ROR97990.1 hypothetical protein EDC56_3659 [Sinobacterium caligoides]